MARAIAGGLLKQGSLNPADIACTSALDGTGTQLAADLDISFCSELPALLSEAEVVILACKPQQLDELDTELRTLTGDKLIISILAGTRISKLRERFPAAANIIRTMPNTPGQIGAGVTAYASEKPLESDQHSHLQSMLNAMGTSYSVEESQLDAVTAVSGSGPAYVFEFIATLRDAGIEAGLEAQTSSELALHTVLGAAKLLEQSGDTPENLRTAVTSPGGTTFAGLAAMEAAGFKQAIHAAVQAAKQRSEELSG